MRELRRLGRWDLQKILVGKKKEALFILFLVAPVFYFIASSWVLVQHQTATSTPKQCSRC